MTLKIKGISKKKFKRLLLKRTWCNIQHDGWCCGICFFGISKKFTNKHWQSLLLYRGSDKKEDLNNLPDKPEDYIKEIWDILNKKENNHNDK